MAVNARQKNGMFRSSFSQSMMQRKFTAPIRLIPIASPDPCAFGNARRALADNGGDLGNGLDVTQIRRCMSFCRSVKT